MNHGLIKSDDIAEPQLTERTAECSKERRHLVVTVHGIRTYGDWQERLEKLLQAKSSDTLEVRNYHYGYFSLLAFFLPPVRWLVTRRFRTTLLKESKTEDWRRIDLVGHSFGTHLIGWGLAGMKSLARPKIHTVILAGSVLKPSFDWCRLMPDYVGRVVNECGTRDGILILNQLFVLFTGMAGRIGFTAMEGRRFRNRYHAFGHSGYFQKSDGEKSDDFMKEYWVPLLTTEEDSIRSWDARSPLSPLGGLREFTLRNLEPIKLVAYLSIIFLVAGWIFELQREAKTGRGARTTLLESQTFAANVERAARAADMPNLARSPAYNAIVTWGDFGNVSLWLPDNEKLGGKGRQMFLDKNINLAAMLAKEDSSDGTDRKLYSESMTQQLGGKVIDGVSGKVLGAVFSSNGAWLAVWDANGAVALRSVPEARGPLRPVTVTGQIKEIKFQIDNESLVILSATNIFTRYQMKDGKTSSTVLTTNIYRQAHSFSAGGGGTVNASMNDGSVQQVFIP